MVRGPRAWVWITAARVYWPVAGLKLSARKSVLPFSGPESIVPAVQSPTGLGKSAGQATKLVSMFASTGVQLSARAAEDASRPAARIDMGFNAERIGFS